MKKSFLIISLAMLGFIQAGAQEYEYVPFVREGVKWVCYYDNPINATDYDGTYIPFGQHFYTLELKGDTVINGKSYKPLHFYSGKSIDEENDTIPVFLREENKIVYGIIPDDTRYYECPIGIGTMVLFTNICATNIKTGVEFTLYDFNDLEAFYDNNAAETPYYSWPLLKRDCSIITDTVLIGDQLRKRLVVHSPYSWDEYIIEGIGYARNGLPGNPFNYFYNITTGVDQVIYNLCHVIENDKIVYRALRCEDLEPEANDYEYVPFVREGVKWVYDYDYDGDTPATLELKGDTIINGKTYKAMHYYCGQSINTGNDTVPVYLREEDKVVYGIVPDGQTYAECPVICLGSPAFDQLLYSGQEFILYDFNNPFQYYNEIKNPDWLYYKLKYNFTDTIEVNGKAVRRHSLSYMDDFCIIEGIGYDGYHAYGYTLAYQYPILVGDGFGRYTSVARLYCVIEDGDTIYKAMKYRGKRNVLPFVREGVKWVNEKVIVNNGDTTRYYYSYTFNGKAEGHWPVDDSYACHYMEEGPYGAETDSIIAYCLDDTGIPEQNHNMLCYDNQALNRIMEKGRNLIDHTYIDPLNIDDEPIVYGVDLLQLYSFNGFDICPSNTVNYFIDMQIEPFLNRHNFVNVAPAIIEDKPYLRYAYIGENGDTLAFVIEGIGFDSRDMGDLITPFIRKPDPNDDHQEWWGLSHVVKDGRIIYKGMRYRDGVTTGIDEVVADQPQRPLDPHYYNLMGQPVGTEVPTAPGIYIHQGKKIIVR